MNADQVILLRDSWTTVAPSADALTIAFYKHLFEIDEGAAQLFAGVDMTGQRAKLVQALALVVKTADDADRLLPAVAALGKRHVGYGVEDRHFDSVGDALIWALSDVLGDAFTADIRDAWVQAYTVIASVMRRALERRTLEILDV